MAGISLRMANDEDPPAKYREARRRRMEMRRLASIAGTSSSPPVESGGDGVGGAPIHKRGSRSHHTDEGKRNRRLESHLSLPVPSSLLSSRVGWAEELPSSSGSAPAVDPASIHGSMSVSGRSREMEDAISVRPDFYTQEDAGRRRLHFFAVFDGHGGSHVAALCKEHMHVFLAEELGRREIDSGRVGEPYRTAEMAAECWSEVMGRCFQQMDELALSACVCGCVGVACGCDRGGLTSEIVGSTAVVAVVGPDRIVVANCGDSRAVLCRGGRAIPLSKDHKPDRPDELARIEAAGGRVIYLNGARVLGILAMSRALGDKYLKPIVISDPEVDVTERSPDDECLILASDGLWDVLSNDMACDVARQCLQEGSPSSTAAGILNTGSVESTGEEEEIRASRSRCSLAAALLTRLALGRKSTDNISVIVIDLKRG